MPTATNLGLTTRDSPHTTVTGPLLLPWSVKVVGRRWLVMTCVISPCGTDDGLWSGLATSHQVTSGTASLVWSNLHRNTIWDRLDSNIKISSVLSSQILSLFSFFSFEPQPIGDIKIIIIYFLLFFILGKLLQEVLVSLVLEVRVPVLALLRLVQTGTLGGPPEPAMTPLHPVAYLHLQHEKCRTLSVCEASLTGSLLRVSSVRSM